MVTNPVPMTVCEELLAVCVGSPKKSYSTHELKRLLKERFGRNPGSVLPSDYCYNRWNEGLDRSRWNPMFRQISRGRYEFIGLNEPFSGPIMAKKQGSDSEEEVGEWNRGKVNFH